MSNSTSQNRLTPSIIDHVIGGSREGASPLERKEWNRANERFYRVCVNLLMPVLKSGSYSRLNHADILDVIQATIIELRKAFRDALEKPDSNRGKPHEGWLLTIGRRRAIDKIRYKDRIARIEFTSLDESVAGDEGLTLAESIGALDELMASWERKDDLRWKACTVEEILHALEAAGRRSPHTLAIFRDFIAGEKPDDIAKRFQASRGMVDNIKLEMKSQLHAIIARLSSGMSLEEAIKNASPKSKKTQK